MGHPNKYLSMGNSAAGQEAPMETKNNTQQWEQFTFSDAGSGKVFIHCPAHNKQVSVHPNKVVGSPNKQDWEKFTVETHGGTLHFCSPFFPHPAGLVWLGFLPVLCSL